MNEGINKEPLSNSLGEKMWDSRYEATSQKNQMTCWPRNKQEIKEPYR